MVTCDLPQEILIDIFLRLPATSVGKCRCLSKQWRILLSTPEFIKSHFTSRPHQENLIVSHSHSIYCITSIKDNPYCRKLELPYEFYGILGSCDGLVLLLTTGTMLLVNPITLCHVEILKVPDLPLALDVYDTFSVYGFGYDSFSYDYKVVALSCYIDYEVDAFYHAFVHVYSVKKGVWKRFGISSYHPLTCPATCGAFSNGAVHWLAYDGEGEDCSLVISAFNLVDEVFNLIHIPSTISVRKFGFNELGVLGRCLCIIDYSSIRHSNRTDIWVMQEYGLEESWTKFSIDIRNYGLQPLCSTWDEEFVMLIPGANLVVYNQKERTLRDMVVDGAQTCFVNGFSFVESLFSPA